MYDRAAGVFAMGSTDPHRAGTSSCPPGPNVWRQCRPRPNTVQKACRCAGPFVTPTVPRPLAASGARRPGTGSSNCKVDRSTLADGQDGPNPPFSSRNIGALKHSYSRRSCVSQKSLLTDEGIAGLYGRYRGSSTYPRIAVARSTAQIVATRETDAATTPRVPIQTWSGICRIKRTAGHMSATMAS